MYPDERYKHDATFNRVVDQMRALLRTYHITPSELREASILAATMHMNENIIPWTFFPHSSIPTYPSIWSTIPSLIKLNPTEHRVAKTTDRRTFTKNNYQNNTRHKWDRMQSEYKRLKKNEQTGDRRKENRASHNFGEFKWNMSTRYRICTHCGLSDVYVFSPLGSHRCSVKP